MHEEENQNADLTDEEIVSALKNLGMSRRGLMKVFGTGAVVAALGGTAAAKKPGGASSDEVYGAPYEASESPPPGLVDQVSELHIREETHPGFPGDGTEFIFDPVGIHVTKNDVVNFAVHNGLHTVTAIHPKFDEPGVFSFPDRVPVDPGFTSPVMNTGDAWLYRFTTPGIYDIMCLPHYTLGMVVRVVVTGPDGSVPADTYDDSLLPPNVEAVFDDPAMTPQNIVDNGTVAWADLSL